jgi:hypothetical protein
MYARCRDCALKKNLELRRKREEQPMVCVTCGQTKPRYSGSTRKCRECYLTWSKQRRLEIKGQIIVCIDCKREVSKAGRHRRCAECANKRKKELRFKRGDRERELLARPRKPIGLDEKIYFIQDVDNRAIKIGWTKQTTDKRLETLQNGNPSELKILVVISGGRVMEKQFHWRFEHLKIRNEWFYPGQDLLDLIASLGRGE